MNHCQAAIFEAPVPLQARHLFFSLGSVEALRGALDRLIPLVDGRALVVGLGQPLTEALGGQVSGLRAFPVFDDTYVETPSTQQALWCWLRGGGSRGASAPLARFGSCAGAGILPGSSG